MKRTVFKRISTALALILLASMFVPVLAFAAVKITNVHISNEGVTADVYTDEYNSSFGKVSLAVYSDAELHKLIGSASLFPTVHESVYYARLVVPVTTSVYNAFYLSGSYHSVQSSVYAVTRNETRTVNGSISGGSALLEGSWLSIHSGEGGNTKYFGTQIKNGQFIFQNLPDGQYVVDGYYSDNWSKWNSIPTAPTFIVKDGQSNPAPLTITIPQNNINGTIKLGDQAITDAWLNLHSTTPTAKSWYSAKISGGKFSFYLPDGSYIVDGYSDPKTYAFTSLPIKVTVSVMDGLSEPQNLNISIPLDNVTGSVYNGVQAVPEGWLSISGQGTVRQWYSAKITNSAFHTYLPDGQYEVQGYTDPQGNFHAFRLPFSIQGGQLETGPLQVVIPTVNVSGNITQGGGTVQNGWVNIHSVGNNPSWYSAKIQNGAFQLYLPDGSYEFAGYTAGEDSKFVPYTVPFTVSVGKSVPKTLNIDVPNKNVSGTLKDGNNNAIHEAWLNIRSESNSPAWFSAKVHNGEFQLYLPDGIYRVVGYTDPATGEFKTLDYAFTVKDGQTESASLHIVLSQNNVFGTIRKGDTLVKDAWLDIQDQGSDSKRYHTKVKNGSFALSLPDGNYKVTGYTTAGSKQYQAADYDFKVEDGRSNPEQLQIYISQDNVSGIIQTQDGPVADAWLLVENTVQRGHKYTVKINDGKFHLYLPDGSYRAAGYYDTQNKTYQQVNYSFTVVSGEVSPNPITITVQPQNVIGKIMLQNQTVNSGWLNIHSAGSNEVWYNAKIQDGTFKLYLPDGQYKVHGYWDEQGKVYTALNDSFTVSQGQTETQDLTFTVPSVTLQGSLVNKEGSPVAQAWVFVKNADTNVVRSFQTQKDGSFSSSLPAGSYKVIGYSIQKNWYALYNYSFTITDSSFTSPVSLQLAGYGVEFTGKVTEKEQALAGVWILLKDEAGGKFYTKTDETGTYEARIPKGNYTLVGVYLGTERGWYVINESVNSGTQTVTYDIEVEEAGQ